jgi:hypothetical protein
MTDEKVIKTKSAYKVVSPTGKIDVDTSNGWVKVILPSLYTTTDDKSPLVITKVTDDKNYVVLVSDGTNLATAKNKDLNILGFKGFNKSVSLSFDGETWTVIG